MSLLDDIQTDVDDAFLDTDGTGFAEEVSYTPDGGSAVTISGIWSDAFEVVDVQTEARTTVPAIICKETDISGNGDGDTIIRNSTTYYVTNIIGQNARGMVALTLSLRAIHG